MYNKINENNKQRLAQRYHSGESAGKICLEHDIPRSTLYYWAKIYKVQTAKTGGAATPKEFDWVVPRAGGAVKLTSYCNLLNFE